MKCSVHTSAGAAGRIQGKVSHHCNCQHLKAFKDKNRDMPSNSTGMACTRESFLKAEW